MALTFRTRPAIAVAAALTFFAARPGDTEAVEPEPLVVFATAQTGETVKVRVYFEADRLVAGSPTKFAVVLDIAPDWHINANPKGAEFQEETAVAVKSKLGTKLSAVRYPPGTDLTIEGLDVPLKVYDRRAIVYGTITPPENSGGQTESIAFGVRYQSCSEDGRCLAPLVEKLTGRLAVARAGETVTPLNAALFRTVAAKVD